MLVQEAEGSERVAARPPREGPGRPEERIVPLQRLQLCMPRPRIGTTSFVLCSLGLNKRAKKGVFLPFSNLVPGAWTT